jgi:hypothetical protein
MDCDYSCRERRQQARNFRQICLGKFLIRRKMGAFFEMAEVVPPAMQSNVWEPGENPGRLRHCNGYKFQNHRQREGGMRFEAKVRIPV